ncbi:MAG: hypothetical protein MPW15_15845 [Candidatus Manganitrophus sp.]|nr:hypothetical protein [Candidatus Manganitrophus sp.]
MIRDGILNIDKPAGWTSHDVVAKIRGLLRIKKVGHAGTLDPEATGVLPICFGKGTKVVPFLMDAEKEYDAVLRLGEGDRHARCHGEGSQDDRRPRWDGGAGSRDGGIVCRNLCADAADVLRR